MVKLFMRFENLAHRPHNIDIFVLKLFGLNLNTQRVRKSKD